MQVSEERIPEFKKIMEEKEGKEVSHQEAYEGAQNLANFVELLRKFAQEDGARKRRLKENPGGFPTDGTRNCSVCHQTINETNGWYDWYGQTCLVCRKAIQEEVVPAFVCNQYDSFYTMSSLNYKFKIKYQTAKKLIREEKLKPRIVLNESGKPHEYIFLKKENPGLIERYNPIRKSYHRQQSKISTIRAREWKKEMLAEDEKFKKKLKRSKLV